MAKKQMKDSKKDWSKRKRQNKSKEAISSDETSVNDISWYSRNPELLAAAARIPFPYKPGMTITVGDVGGTTGVTYLMPGVCSIKYVPSIGKSTDVNSPASIAAREMYARIRKNYSGSLEADAPDIFMYCLALDQVHAFIAYAKRLYRCINLFSPYNRDYPNRILKAMGVNSSAVDDLQAQKIRLWGYINTLVNMVNKFAVPDDMDIYHRHRWMNEHIYLDEPMPNAQSFIFVPAGFWKFGLTGDASSLLYTSMPTWQQTSSKDISDQIYEYGRTLIDALSDWDDAYTINGYMLRAYEGTNFYTAALLLQDEIQTPVYEPEVLSQIENATAMGTVNSLDVTQDVTTNAILHSPTATIATYQADPIMNLHTTDPTASDVTIASRLMAYVVDGKIIGGTEIVTEVSYTMANTNDPYEMKSLKYINSYDISNTSLVTYANLHAAIYQHMAFSHAPMCWVRYYSSSDSYVDLIADVCNLTLIPVKSLEEITRVCIYSEFNCFR